MKYEYVTIRVFGFSDSPIKNDDLEKLSGLYSDGWEFVDSVQQNVSVSSSSKSYSNSTAYGPILYTLRKGIDELKL